MNAPYHQPGFAFVLLLTVTILPFIAAIHHQEKGWEMILRLEEMPFVSQLPLLSFHSLLARSPAHAPFLLGFAPFIRLLTPSPSSQLMALINITAPPFLCVNGPSGTSLVAEAGGDFCVHTSKGHNKSRNRFLPAWHRSQRRVSRRGAAYRCRRFQGKPCPPDPVVVLPSPPLFKAQRCLYATKMGIRKKGSCRMCQLLKSYCYLLYRSSPWSLNWILTVGRQIRQAVGEGRDGARGLS